MKNIFKIIFMQIMLTQIALPDDGPNNIYGQFNDNGLFYKNIFYQKIDLHLVDFQHLKLEDSQDIQKHSNMSYDYNCDHDYSSKKNTYCGGDLDSNIPFGELKNYESLNNKEKLIYLKKDRENTLQKSLNKINRINMHDFTFTPFHVDILKTP